MEKRQHIAALSLLLAVMLMATSIPHHHHATRVCMAADVHRLADALNDGHQSHLNELIQHHLTLTACGCMPLPGNKLWQAHKQHTSSRWRVNYSLVTLEPPVELDCKGRATAVLHDSSPHDTRGIKEAFTLRPPPTA